ncbi:hypothetical protein [Lysinibacillus sp. NPDC086135]|uniref:hypothetical protein n=1 Tax=Lysinibacillus sp. NPDC086135 TaxID=3364130 RepID=UPI0038196F53
MIEKLLNGKFKENKGSINKKVVALVYSDDGRTQGQCAYYREEELKSHILNKGIDLENIKILHMENSRIFGTDIEFNKVYYCKEITLGTYRELKKRFVNLEEFEI